MANTTQPERQQAAQDDALLHVLPRFFQVVQDVILLPLIVIAEMWVNGYMMASGLVGNPDNPFAGGAAGWLHEAMWLTLFLAGAVMGGMVLRLSAAAFYWFGRNPLIALVNVFGMFFLAASEVWGSLMLRSYAPTISPADSAALSYLGIQHPPVSITDLFVAVGLPTVSLLWGFSTMKHAQKSDAEVAEDYKRKAAKARGQAELRQIQVAGWAGAARAGVETAFARQVANLPTDNSASSHSQDAPLGDDNPPGGGGSANLSYLRQDGASDESLTGGLKVAPARKQRALAMVGGIPSGWIDAAGLVEWSRTNLPEETSDRDALAFIKAQPASRQTTADERVQGRPWIAPKAQTLAAAKRKWSARPTGEAADA